LRQHFLAGQHAFAQATAEGFVADLHHALQHAGLPARLAGTGAAAIRWTPGRRQLIRAPSRTRCCSVPRGTPTSCAARQTVTLVRHRLCYRFHELPRMAARGQPSTVQVACAVQQARVAGGRLQRRCGRAARCATPGPCRVAMRSRTHVGCRHRPARPAVRPRRHGSAHRRPLDAARAGRVAHVQAAVVGVHREHRAGLRRAGHAVFIGALPGWSWRRAASALHVQSGLASRSAM
jgi:hypothetical protein